jgi:hypothetical protein
MLLRLRAIGWVLALSAIMLRAALPAGWMPVADGSGGSALVICTGHGPLTAPVHSHKQAPLPGHGNDVCPFAAVGHLSPPATIALLVAPIWHGRKTDPAETGRIVLLSPPAHSNQTPRAPPFAV